MAAIPQTPMPLWMDEIVNPSQTQSIADIPPPTGLTIDAINELYDGMVAGSRPAIERPRRVEFDGRSYYMTGDAFTNPPSVTSIVTNYPTNAITYGSADAYRLQWDTGNRSSYWISTLDSSSCGTYTVTTEPPVLEPFDQLKNLLDALDHEYHEEYEEEADGQPVQESPVSEGDTFRVHLDGLAGDIQLSRSAVYAAM